MITAIIMKKINIFKNMGENIPGGNFPWEEILLGGIF